MDLNPKPTFGSYSKGLSYYTLIYLWKKIEKMKETTEKGRKGRDEKENERTNNKWYV